MGKITKKVIGGDIGFENQHMINPLRPLYLTIFNDVVYEEDSIKIFGKYFLTSRKS